MHSSAKGLQTSLETLYCFVAGTLVTTADGLRPIEEIELGDLVLSEDENTGEVAYKRVTKTFVNETTELIHVHAGGETISTTPAHPFYVSGFGWTLAGNLRAGDVLVLSNGSHVLVEWVQHEILEAPIHVYNFEVEEFHTYFVGECGVLVHNWCKRKNEQRKKYEEYTGKKPTGEIHHGLPEKYKEYFESRKYEKHALKKGQTLDINSGEFYYDLSKGRHRMKADHGVHTNNSYAGKTWDKAWEEFINKNPYASAEEVLAHLRTLEREFGISKYRARKG